MHPERVRALTVVLASAALGGGAGPAMVSAWAWPVLLVALAVLNALVVWQQLRPHVRLASIAGLLLALFWVAADPVGHAFADNFALHPFWRPLTGLLVGAFVTLWYLPAAWFAIRISHRVPRAAVPAVLGAGIALSEWLRVEVSHVPVALLAYGLTDTPLLLVAPWAGAYGAGALAVIGAGWIAMAGLSRKRFAPALLATCALLAMGVRSDGIAQATELPPGTRTTVSLMHSLPLHDVSRTGLKARVEAMMAAVEAADGDLIVFGETALPMPWELLPVAVREKFHQLATDRKLTIVMGAFRQHQQESFNSAIVISPNSSHARFIDKHLLFPVSEFLPAGLAWIREAMHMAPRDLSAGPMAVQSVESGNHRFGIVICYEIGSPSLFAARASDMNWMLLISDLSWFPGPKAAVHLRSMARWRAAETGRWLLSVSLPDGSMLVNPEGVTVDVPAPRAQLWTLSVPARH